LIIIKINFFEKIFPKNVWLKSKRSLSSWRYERWRSFQ
jgi:hypothetical protein